MKKSEKISIAIGKCFSRSSLSQDDIIIIKELGASGLLDEGLNENQIRQVMLWCQNECQKGWAQNQYEPHYNLDSLDIYDPKRKEKTLQSVYDDMIPSPYKELSHRGFRT